MNRTYFLGLLLLLGACTGSPSVQPLEPTVHSGTPTNVSDLNVTNLDAIIRSQTQGAPLASVQSVMQNDRKFELHTLVVDPLKQESNFQLVRYFLAPEEWSLRKLTYNQDGTRTYIFQRIVPKGPRIEADPLKPRVATGK